MIPPTRSISWSGVCAAGESGPGAAVANLVQKGGRKGFFHQYPDHVRHGAGHWPAGGRRHSIVENVKRIMSEEGLSPKEATIKSMGQITDAKLKRKNATQKSNRTTDNAEEVQ